MQLSLPSADSHVPLGIFFDAGRVLHLPQVEPSLPTCSCSASSDSSVWVLACCSAARSSAGKLSMRFRVCHAQVAPLPVDFACGFCSCHAASDQRSKRKYDDSQLPKATYDFAILQP